MTSPIPQGDCRVTINGNNFNIAIGTRQKEVNYSGLYSDFLTKISSVSACAKILTDNNITSFETLNAAINYGDSIKDGTSAYEMATLNVFSFIAPGRGPNPTSTSPSPKGFILTQLKEFAHAVKDHLIQLGEITRVAFARDKKGDVSAKKRWESVYALCAFDSGLGLDAWLTFYKIFTSFGKYIDPSTGRNSDYVFPIIGKFLAIDTNVFTQLGYGLYCNLTYAICHAHHGETYTYDMTVNSYLPVGPTTYRPMPMPITIAKMNRDTRDDDPNKNSVFPGNAAKKSFTGDDKFVGVVMKGLGDKLQVFLAFVLKNVMPESNRSVVCVATCDEIVLLFCTLMNVPCWFTSIGVENGLKVNEVLYYNKDNNSPASVKKRIKSEYDVVKKGYDDLILLIDRISDSNLLVQVSGDNKMQMLHSDFYARIIADLTIIRDNVSSVYDGHLRLNDDIQNLNDVLTCIKSAAVNNFFREARDHSNIALIRTANKYNSSTDPRINAGISKRNKLTFLEYAKTFVSARREGLQHFNGGAKMETIDMERFFNNDKLITFFKPDELLNPTDWVPYYIEKPFFDAAFNLKDEIFKIYNEPKDIKRPKKWDALSDVLHQLNFNDCSTATLEKLVRNFKLNVIASNKASRSRVSRKPRPRAWVNYAKSPEHSSAKQNPTLTGPTSRSSAASHSSPVPFTGNFGWAPVNMKASQKPTRSNSNPKKITRRLKTPVPAERRRLVLKNVYARSSSQSKRNVQKHKVVVKSSNKNRKTANRTNQFNVPHLNSSSHGGRRVTQKKIKK